LYGGRLKEPERAKYNNSAGLHDRIQWAVRQSQRRLVFTVYDNQCAAHIALSPPPHLRNARGHLTDRCDTYMRAGGPRVTPKIFGRQEWPSSAHETTAATSLITLIETRLQKPKHTQPLRPRRSTSGSASTTRALPTPPSLPDPCSEHRGAPRTDQSMVGVCARLAPGDAASQQP
jgi:hypothetical protein